jgi:hypothetical protein
LATADFLGSEGAVLMGKFIKSGIAEGFYGQAKLIYGNLSPLDSIFLGGVIVNERWSTYGVGVGCGNKFLFAKHFTIEYLVGARILSPPPYFLNTSKCCFLPTLNNIMYICGGIYRHFI